MNPAKKTPTIEGTKETQLKLVILVPNQDIEQYIRGLLPSLRSFRIRNFVLENDVRIIRDPGRGASCRKNAVGLLRGFISDETYAIVIFDLDGCGDDRDATEVATSVEEDLNGNGWMNRSAAIVIEPALEAWAWSDPGQVSTFVDWLGGETDLLEKLGQRGFKYDYDRKSLDRPKNAFRLVCKSNGIPRSAYNYLELAKQGREPDKCTDPSFQRLITVLQEWFPKQPG